MIQCLFKDFGEQALDVLVLTCCSSFDLGHVVLQHLWISGAVWSQFRVKAGGDVLGGIVSSLGVTGCNLWVPVGHQDMVPVNVLPVHTRTTVPQVVEDMHIIEDAVISIRFGDNHLGVTAAKVFHFHIQTLLVRCQEVHPGRQVREAVAGFECPQPHQDPKNEQGEE